MSLQKQSLTLILLCMGYCIDFYDLTLMSVSYPELIPQKFHLSNVTEIQQTYLLISNFQTLGILIGAIIFGLLGDKIGRACAIKYSILLYSITTLLAVYTDSLPLFILCRLLAYIGLATEFSTSTVLIYELFNFKSAAWGTAILYIFGVLGGLAATSISFISWQATFILGGSAGLLLYCARHIIKESEHFIHYKNSELKVQILKSLFGNAAHRRLLLRYFLMMTPYSVMISLMFIFPNFIIKDHSLGTATRLLLLGFFIGNMISSLLSPIFLHFRKQFMLVSLGLFFSLMLCYRFVPEQWLFIYSCGLCLTGGG
jgi:MFS family permease